jgi:glycosyltransferase involved in cell wall biosynthesis
MGCSSASSDGPTLWIDLSDLAAWSGELTGIQRVSYALARYASESPGVRFFAHDASERNFRSVDFTVLRRAFEGRAGARQADSRRSGAGSASEAAPTLAWRALRRSVGRRFSFATRRELLVMGKAAHAIGGALGRLSAHAVEPRAGEPVRFEPGDRILVPGNCWNDRELLPSLSKLKHAARVRIHHLLYDLIPVRSPHFAGTIPARNYATALVLLSNQSDGLLAVSERSRCDMQQYCAEHGLRTPPIEVIRLGDELFVDTGDEVSVAGLAPQSFLLAVGTLEVRKNQLLLYYCYKEALRRGIALPTLVLVGRTTWSGALVERLFLDDPELSSRVLLLSSCSDGELAWLLRNCLLAVYPSFDEGFGLPIVEALRYGRACFAADTSGLPEVAAGLVEVFSPYDPLGCLRLIERYLEPSVRSAQEARIRAEYRAVSWAETARRVTELVRAPGVSA